MVRDREAWRAAVHGVTKSGTQLSDQHFSIFSDHTNWGTEFQGLIYSAPCAWKIFKTGQWVEKHIKLLNFVSGERDC